VSEEATVAEAAKETDQKVEEKQNEVEAIAQKLRWNPEYDGDDAKTAQEFILNSRDIQKTQRDHAKRLQSEIEELRNGFGAFQEHVKATYASQVEEYKQKIEDLKAERKAAMKDGDVDAVDAIERKLENTAKQKPKAPPTTPNYSQAEVNSWFDQNAWANPNSREFNQEMANVVDSILSPYAIFQGDQVVGYKVSVPRLLEKARKEVKGLYPEKFEKKKDDAPPRAPAMEGATNQRQSASKNKKYSKLNDFPEEMRRTVDQFVNKMKIRTFEEIADEYKKQGIL
jgi:hypothetical protein